MSKLPVRDRLQGLSLFFILAFIVPVLSAQEEAPTFAGSEACGTCHEEILQSFQKNRHAALDSDEAKQWAGKVCESCHGPGGKHAESMEASDVINPAKVEPSRADQRCLTCHLNTSTHVGRLRGGHARNQVGCTNCHPVHSAPELKAANRHGRVNEQCASCHGDVWASFQRPYGHKLPQGAMSCVDCHNPHGGAPPADMRLVSANEPTCFRCHGDKRGPFVFEHAPMRLESCMTCHVPHGSANPRMLIRHEVSNLCLECHSNIGFGAATSSGTIGGPPPAIHDLRSPRYRNCTMCHQKIHGSQVNRDFLR